MKLATLLLLTLLMAAVGSLEKDVLIALCRLIFVVFATLAATLGSGLLFRPQPIPLRQDTKRQNYLERKL